MATATEEPVEGLATFGEEGGAVMNRVPGRWVLGWELGGPRPLRGGPVLVALAEGGERGTLIDSPAVAAAAWTALVVQSRLAQAELAQQLTAPLSAAARETLRHLQALADDDGRGQLTLELGPASEAVMELVTHGCARSRSYAALERVWCYRLAPALRRGWLASLRRGAPAPRRSVR